MRIVAGSLGGRNFDSKSKVTHPMSEKMRGAIFNTLGNIEGLSVLDVFSGSGSISFEAVSRGAKDSLAIESNKHAQKDIEKNISKLGLADQVKLVKANFSSWLTTTNHTFDIIICDPPYDDIQLDKIVNLESRLIRGGILVLSLPPSTELPYLKNLNLVSEKPYGDSKLVFYKNNL